MTRGLFLTRRSWTGRQVFAVSLLLLLFVDGLFFGAHIMRALLNETSYQGFLLDVRWSLEIDRSYPERFQYLQSGLAAVVLFVLYTRHRSLTYLGWSLAFLFILIDDSFSLHEHFGRVFTAYMGSTSVLGIETRFYAESLLWGLVGLVLLVILGFGYRRDPRTRRFSRRLAYCLAALFFFGGFVDALHLLAQQGDAGRMLTFFIATLEDGGELLVISVALAYILAYFTDQPGQIAKADRR